MKNIAIVIIAALLLCLQNVGFAQSEEKTVEKKAVQYQYYQHQYYQPANSEEVVKLDLQSKITDEQMPEILSIDEAVKTNTKAYPLLYAVDEKGNITWGKNVDEKTRKKLMKKQRKELK